jgi:hypothetical protein
VHLQVCKVLAEVVLPGLAMSPSNYALATAVWDVLELLSFPDRAEVCVDAAVHTRSFCLRCLVPESDTTFDSCVVLLCVQCMKGLLLSLKITSGSSRPSTCSQ